jgi:predicted Zn-dependent protease
MRLRELFKESLPSIRNGREGKVDQALLAKCQAIREKLAQTAEVQYQAIIRASEINLSWNEEDKVYASPANGIITIDQEEFADAPTVVLVWLIAHEIGHIVFEHGPARGQNSQAQEMAADAFANDLAVKMGFTKAPVWTWLGRRKNELGQTENDLILQIERDPDNADYFRNKASHPTTDQRRRQAELQGLELSKPNTDQIDWLMSHLA